MKKILVATDGSHGALAAVEEGIELALSLGSELRFVSVEHVPPPPAGYRPTT